MMSATSHGPPRVCRAELHRRALGARSAERRVRWVSAVTLLTMAVELLVGYSSRSLALVADGWHMAAHAGALAVAAVAYWYARARALDPRFAFGTGKIHALAGFTNAVVLLLVALELAVDALQRIAHPEPIAFSEAIPVAALGLLVNLISVALLHGDEARHGHSHADEHKHDHHGHDHHGHDHHGHDHHGHQHHHGHDHNFRAVYLHIVADLVTSVSALLALIGARHFGVLALDSVIALGSGCLIARWALSLCAATAHQLVDAVPLDVDAGRVRAAVEALGGAEVIDLHLWPLGEGATACVVTIRDTVSRHADDYRGVILAATPLAHLTVEVEHGDADAPHRCHHDRGARGAAGQVVVQPA